MNDENLMFKKISEEEKQYRLEQLIEHAPDLVAAAKRREAQSLVAKGLRSGLTYASGVILSLVGLYALFKDFIINLVK